MRAYVTIVDGDDALLPFFLEHYSRLGATEFPLLVYGTGQQLARAAQTIRQLTGDCFELGLYDSNVFSAKHREAAIGEFHPRGQWAFFCDLDEFAELTPDDVRWVPRSGMPYLAGRWVDRVASDGRLADVCVPSRSSGNFPCPARSAHWHG